MERQDIEVFLALAHELHFARTAQRLNLASASISQTIKKLERRFGAHLFTRTTRRVDLTSPSGWCCAAHRTYAVESGRRWVYSPSQPALPAPSN